MNDYFHKAREREPSHIHNFAIYSQENKSETVATASNQTETAQHITAKIINFKEKSLAIQACKYREKK